MYKTTIFLICLIFVIDRTLRLCYTAYKRKRTRIQNAAKAIQAAATAEEAQ